jgi:hypothetical protein
MYLEFLLKETDGVSLLKLNLYFPGHDFLVF